MMPVILIPDMYPGGRPVIVWYVCRATTVSRMSELAVSDHTVRSSIRQDCDKTQDIPSCAYLAPLPVLMNTHTHIYIYTHTHIYTHAHTFLIPANSFFFQHQHHSQFRGINPPILWWTIHSHFRGIRPLTAAYREPNQKVSGPHVLRSWIACIATSITYIRNDTFLIYI